MTLTSGTRLGPFEVLAPIGAGGMGEVYRARDARLGREVAVKVLSDELSSDADRRGRFEQEARSASALNHPNIVTIYEIGGTGATTYIAMELVHGRTLREVLQAGPLATRRLLDLAFQMADALAKAHGAGIVHRDIKPENVMVTAEGTVKVLDFGLAKLLKEQPADASNLPTAQETRAGTVLGTVGYMSPEQAAGRPIDFASDQFALGSIFYEMATGRRAFQRGTSAETLTAIIREEAEPVAQINAAVPAPFRWIIERCLQKDPHERYASTRDLAKDVRSLREHLSEAPSGELAATPGAQLPEGRRSRVSAARAALYLAALLLAFAAGVLAHRRFSVSAPASYQQLTFGRGTIRSARFAPDGQTIIYSAAWDDGPLKLFLKHPSSPDSLPLELPSANLLGISASGEMAIAVACRSNHPGVCRGTFARAALTGGAPRDVAEGIQDADWAPNGSDLLVVRDVDGKARIEFPMGKVLYETTGHVSYARLSPKADKIAFMDHTFPDDDAGVVAIVDLAGKKTVLTGRWASEHGLAWSPGGEEVWFTATEAGANRSLYAVSPEGRLRVVARVPGGLKLHDIAKSGRVLLTRESPRVGILGAMQGDTRERDLSFLDYSFAADMAQDGRVLLFDEEGEAGGANYTVFVRKSDRSPVVRLGEGNALSLSPDLKWALSMMPVADSPFILLPTGTGERRQVATGSVHAEQAATWLPDSRSFLFAGSEPGHALRLYKMGIDGGAARPVGPEAISAALPGFAVSPDGRTVAAVDGARKLIVFPLEGGSPVREIPGGVDGEFPLRFSPDGRALYLWKKGDVPARVSRVDVETGKREVWKDLLPADPAGVERISNVLLTPDAKGYAYCYARLLSDLFVVEGLR
jgi:hypothetical protein